MDIRPESSNLSYLQLAEMGSSHLRQVAEIHSAINPSPWSIEQWRVCCENPGYRNWVAIGDDQIVAFASFMCPGVDAELLNIGVMSGYQGQGIGEDLLTACLSLLPDETEHCFLEVRRSNIPAINLYKKLSFKQIAERKDYYRLANGLIEDALLFKKRL